MEQERVSVDGGEEPLAGTEAEVEEDHGDIPGDLPGGGEAGEARDSSIEEQL